MLGGIEVNLIEDKQGHQRIPILKEKFEEEFLLEGWKGKSQKKRDRFSVALYATEERSPEDEKLYADKIVAEKIKRIGW